MKEGRERQKYPQAAEPMKWEGTVLLAYSEKNPFEEDF
jgi:hypothetical protein